MIIHNLYSILLKSNRKFVKQNKNFLFVLIYLLMYSNLDLFFTKLGSFIFLDDLSLKFSITINIIIYKQNKNKM